MSAYAPWAVYVTAPEVTSLRQAPLGYGELGPEGGKYTGKLYISPDKALKVPATLKLWIYAKNGSFAFYQAIRTADKPDNYKETIYLNNVSF